MPDDLLAAVRAALPGSRITDQTLRTVIDAIESLGRFQQPPPEPAPATPVLPQWGWLCNGEPVPGGMTAEPAAHWLPLYVGERHA